MNFLDYQRLAFRTAKKLPTTEADLLHAQIGMTTETGEFATDVKRCAIYGKPLDPAMKAHMLEELGDLLWYVALAATSLEASLGDIAQANIDKLAVRFPDKYTDQAAEARADKGGLDARAS